MGLPTGDTITVSQSGITLRGNKSFGIEMTIQDNTGGTDFATSYGMKISDIGGYEVDLDVIEDTDDITEYYYNVGEYEFEFFSTLGDGTDFGEILRQLTFTDLVQVDVTYDGNTDSFLCQKLDFEYDRLARKVSVKSYSPFKYGEQITTYTTTGYSVPIKFDDGGLISPVDYDFIPYYEGINAFLNTLGTGLTTRIVTSYSITKSDLESETGTDVPVSGFVAQDNGNTQLEGVDDRYVIATYATLRERILEGGLAEAAVVGNLFGEAYYVRRDYKDTGDSNFLIDIESSDLEEFNIQFFTSSVRSISITTAGSTQSEDITGLEDNPQTITLRIPDSDNQFANPCQFTDSYDFGGGVVADRVEQAGLGEVSPTTLATDSLEIFKKILGATDSIRWSGTILGVDNLKPYQFIRLNTGISDFIDADNRIIRPSKLKYNFKEDKVEFEAYSI